MLRCDLGRNVAVEVRDVQRGGRGRTGGKREGGRHVIQRIGNRVFAEDRAGNGVVDHERAVLEADKGILGGCPRDPAERGQNDGGVKAVHYDGDGNVLRMTLLRPCGFIGTRERVKGIMAHAVADAVDLFDCGLGALEQAKLMQRERADGITALQHGDRAASGAADKPFILRQYSVVFSLDLRLLAAL